MAITAYEAWPLAVLFLLACGMSLGRGPKLRKGYLILSGVFPLYGMLRLPILRFQLTQALERKSTGMLNEDTREWILEKFDHFLLVGVVVLVVVVVWFAVLLLLRRREIGASGGQERTVTMFIAVLMVLFPLVSLIYSYGTINKLFDVLSYIIAGSVFADCVLFLPFFIKRLLAQRMETREQD